MSLSSQHSPPLRSVEVAQFETLLERIGAQLAATAHLYDERGAFLAGVIVSDGIRPGVVQIATGAWFDPWVPGERHSLEKHGNPNMITADVGASSLSQGCSAQTASVEIVKWDQALPAVTAFEPPSMV